MEQGVKMKILGSKKLQERIKELLTINPVCKDDDNKLIANIWWDSLGLQAKQLSAYDLLKKLADGKMPSADGITRCRRKLQEQNPELRGKMWYKRHKMQEQVMLELDNIKG